MLGSLGKIVAFVTFVCFAIEKEAKSRPRLGRANRKAILEDHFCPPSLTNPFLEQT
jgi:hypothetical protein